MRRGDLADGLEMFGGQMSRVQAQMDLLGVAAGRFFERHDLLRKNFRFVVAVVDFTDDHHCFPRHHEFAVFVVIIVHEQQRERTGHVLQCRHGVRFVRLPGDALLHGGDETANARRVAIGYLRHASRVRQRVFLQQRHVGRERMARDVKSEQLFLGREQLALRPFGQTGHRLKGR